MAVFLAAGDESDGPLQRGPFLYGGFVAPVKEWIDSFAPAWEERVLNLDPPIPFLHMVEIRKSSWRQKYGLTLDQAEQRVEEAARIIGGSGHVSLVKTEFDGGHFRDVFGATKVIRLGNQPTLYRFEPDFIGFIGFVYAALDYVAQRYPDAEQVDFVVEQKSSVSRNIDQFYETIEDALTVKGRADLVPLIGELNPNGDKKRVPLQAADIAMWHLRRRAVGDADRDDMRRLARMFDGREMMLNGMTLEEISGMGLRSKAYAVPNPFPPRIKFGGGGAA